MFDFERITTYMYVHIHAVRLESTAISNVSIMNKKYISSI